MRFIMGRKFPVFGLCALLLSVMTAHAGMPISTPATRIRDKGPGVPAAAAVPWAVPLAGGPLKVLAVAPRGTLRDVTELSKRLDMRVETVALWDAAHAGHDPADPDSHLPGTSAEETLARFRELLRGSWDVLLLGNLDTASLPEDLVADLFDRVAAGAGLVLAHLRDAPDSPSSVLLSALEPVDPPPPVRRGVADTGLHGWEEGEDPVRVLAHGAGRVVVLEYPGDPPQTHFLLQAPEDPLDMDPVLVDNLWSLVVRAVLAAARRESPVRITGIGDAAPAGPAEEEIPPDFTPEFTQSMRDSMAVQPLRPFTLALEGAGKGRHQAEVRLRRPGSDAQVVYLDDTPLPQDAASWPFDMVIGPGLHYLDVRLLRDGKAADWHTRRFELGGWPEFTNVQYGKTWVQPNDSLEISLRVRPVFNQTRSCTMYARAVDPHGRVVAEAARKVSNEGGQTALALHFTDLAAPLLRIEVYGIEGETNSVSGWELQRAPRAYRYVSVRPAPPETAPSLVVAGPAPVEPNQELAYRALARLGVDTLHAPGGEAALVRIGLTGLQFLPEITQIAAGAAEDGVARRPCLSDPDYLSRLRREAEEGALLHWAGASGRCSLGGANCVCATEENVCQAGPSLEAFQEWLRREYGGLAALNQSWRTDFADWDEALPLNCDEARSSGRAAPWVDFRRFMEETFAGVHGLVRGQVRRADRGMAAGFRVLDDRNPSHGAWWPLLAEAGDFLAADWDPVTVEKLRSYQRPGAWTGVCFPDARALGGELRAAWIPWRALLRRIPAVWLGAPFGTAETPQPHALLGADDTPHPAFAALAREMTALKAGPGMLLLHANPEKPAVLVYDSHASRHFNDVDHEPGTSRDAQRGWVDCLEWLRVPWAFADRQRLGMLDDPACRVLVLPRCTALDDMEVAAMVRFAGRGGLLLADLLPAVADGHGALREDFPLAPLFEEPPVPSGAPEGDTPPAPKALLLDRLLPPRDAGGDRSRIPADYVRVREFLTRTGFPEPVILPEDFDGEARLLTYGNTRLLALLASPEAAQEQRVRLPFGKDDTVYDVRAGVPVARPHRATVRLAPGETRLYARTEYAVGEIALAAPASAAAGTRLEMRAAVTPRKGAPGRHLLRFEVMTGGTAAQPWQRRLVDCPAGAGECQIPLARSEALGRCLVRVTDVLSGVFAEAALEIAPPATL